MKQILFQLGTIRSRGAAIGSLALVGLVGLWSAASCAPGADGAGGEARKLVLIAGKPSHPPLMHEFRAGSLLLEQCLRGVPGLKVEVHTNGWVSDEKAFEDADAVVIFADGGGGHPALQGEHLETLRKLMARGVGFGCMHYGVEVPPDKGSAEFKQWIGGHYEHQFSCNPIWEPDFSSLPEHPITRGVKPFQIKDEWYFNMRFFDDSAGNEPTEKDGFSFTPILVAKPSDDVRDGPYVYPQGPYDHIVANSGRPEAMMWAVERPDGGRGFGFTGGHFHLNWGNDDFRKTVLNALTWVAKAEVPADGIASSVEEDALYENLDPKGPVPERPKKGAANGTASAHDRSPAVPAAAVPSRAPGSPLHRFLAARSGGS